MARHMKPVRDWLGNTRPCLRNALRTYKAARLLQDFGMYPESGSQSHRLVESVMEAAIARTGTPILDRYASGTSPLLNGKQVRSEHAERRAKFQALYVDSSNTKLTPEQRLEAAKIISLFSTQARNRLLYVDYYTRRTPQLGPDQCEYLIHRGQTFYRIVRTHLDPLPRS